MTRLYAILEKLVKERHCLYRYLDFYLSRWAKKKEPADVLVFSFCFFLFGFGIRFSLCVEFIKLKILIALRHFLWYNNFTIKSALGTAPFDAHSNLHNSRDMQGAKGRTMGQYKWFNCVHRVMGFYFLWNKN